MDKVDYNLLMERAAKGDETAFRQLATALTQRMFNLAYRLMGYHRDAAEDVVQDALIKLWKSAPNWKPTGSLEAYASRLVYTTCMDSYRRRKPTEEIPETLATNDNDADDYIIIRQQRDALMDAIDRLPQRQKDATLLFYMNEFSQAHVAKILGTSEKAVEHLLARARKHLKEMLPATIKEGGYLS
jgi:RNA polymerase sigma-70 factor (ECF subfamily)